MKKEWLLAIDQGTTRTRSIVVGPDARPRPMSYREHCQIKPQAGWVEHDPEEIWNNVSGTASAALRTAGISASDLAGIGIANQGETVMAWDALTGKPVYNAIVWQCSRTAEEVELLKRDELLVRDVHSRTGLSLDAYFSASKIRWLWRNVPECRALAREQRLRVGTLDTWLMWKWSEGETFLTDASTASRTLLMDLRTRDWDPVLLDLFEVDRPWLPGIRPPMDSFGDVPVDGVAVPVLASVVDQQAALFGHCCFRPGMAKCTLGTGAFLLMNMGGEPAFSSQGLLSTLAWGTRDSTTYALDGGVYCAASAVNWLRELLGLVGSAAEASELAASALSSGGLTFIPSLAGLAAPYWNRSAKGLLYGFTTASTRAEVVRAVFEGIALRIETVARAMAHDSGVPLQAPLRVDGGLSQSPFLIQFLADVLDCPVETSSFPEMTALGVACMAGLQAGVFSCEDELGRLRCPGKRYEPAMSGQERAGHINRHRRAIEHILHWEAANG